ncbi:MAG TPA: pyridoxal-phosphate dependent enzyme [Actinomycetota bacterium]|nr:pyridoxal-phosphate dependent enzyme [Actinomycetota bacterium]
MIRNAPPAAPARLELGSFPTPLHPAPRLAQSLGIRRELWVKRDDLSGPALGGSKVRKLEYLLADAERSGADAVVTVGAGQSNHARLTAVLGATRGLEVHLVLGGGTPQAWEGNALIGRLAGGAVHPVDTDDWGVLARKLMEVTEDLRRRGRSPYPIPMGGSTPVGSLGYATAYLELLAQLEAAGVEADWVVLASSTGGTQAGLLAGRMAARRGPRVVGVDVAKGGEPLRETVHRLARETARLLGVDGEPDEVLVVEGAGPAYGAVTPEVARVLVRALRSEGLLVDPVYSGKAVAALPALSERLDGRGPLVFLHTGGQPALFARRYATDVLEQGGGS